MVKSKIVAELRKWVTSRITEAQNEIHSIQFSKNNETKSSAGDKYETGMAMLQQEEEKAFAQLVKVQEFNRIVSLLKPEETNNSVQFGSLVETNLGRYFFSFALGKIEIDQEEVFAISLVSPIGQLLKNQKIGFKTIFQGKTVEIFSIT